MEEPERTSPSQPSSSSSSSSSSDPSSSSQPPPEDALRWRSPRMWRPWPRHHRSLISYRLSLFTATDETSAFVRDDTWSCVMVLLSFWFFVSVTMILGVYGSETVRLGPDSSLLVQISTFFVQSLKVEEVDGVKPGAMLYGFYRPPPLDVTATWSQTLNVSTPAYSTKEWIYHLNAGSQINISFTMNSTTSASAILIIAEGNEEIAQWLDDPSYPDATLSWNNIHGSGMIQQDIFRSSSYYIGVGNMNSEDVEVQLKLEVMASLYNKTEAYYKCSLSDGVCNLQTLFPKGNTAVLASPGPEQGTSTERFVKVTYVPRWITYIAGIGGMTVLMFLAFNYIKSYQYSQPEGTGVDAGALESERDPLLAPKDDLSSYGSSYDSVSSDGEDPEDPWKGGSLEGKSVKDPENNNNPRRLCVICSDEARDCFFLPCGHCAACFDCGASVAEATGTCPICHRTVKKVRKIITV